MFNIQKYYICVTVVIIAFTSLSVKADYEVGLTAYKNKNYKQDICKKLQLDILNENKTRKSKKILYQMIREHL